MSDSCKPSLRIDWYDGTVIEDTRPNASISSEFADEDQPEPRQVAKPHFSEKKPIGFKRLLDISLLKPPILTLEVSHRPGFWNLLDTDLKGDFIVLIVRILANICNALQPGDNSKIITLLKTKLEAKFLEKLKDYLMSLPGVRVVEKRMNSFLWDDVQSFYFDVLSLCKRLYKLGDCSLECLKNITDLLEIAETSAYGVIDEHTETIPEKFFEEIIELRSNIQKDVQNEQKQDLTPQKSSTISKDHFKYLPIFPTKQDLLQSCVNIKPNIIDGAYPSVEQYLDLQYKLLREDYIASLREGICKYLENPSKRKHENIRVYPKVRIIRTFITNNKVGHLVDIAWTERVTQGTIDSKKYAYNKQLMFGSLLLLTSDNFDTILCATVLDSSLELLVQGYVAVSFQNPISNKICTEPYLMVESEVFFEPYHRVLQVLQNSNLDELPMKKYIVEVQKENRPPSYLTPETMYTVQEGHQNEEITFPVLETDKWPTESFGLDLSQTEAFKFALTREFAVIQGPPGTGKTFIGVKIATTLLKNLSLEGTPMLIICYTNHALDQFLEAILNVTDNVVRLGSQSKSKILEPYNLNNIRGKTKSKYSHLYGSKRAELEKIYKQMTELQTEIEKCEKEILTYNSIKPYLNFELKCSKEDSILEWLFKHIEEVWDEDSDEENWENYIEEDKIDTCFSEQSALKEIDSMQNSIKYVKDVTDDHCEGEKMTDRFESEIRKVRRRLSCFKKHIAAHQKEGEQLVKLQDINDPYKLSPEDRWKAYFAAVGELKSKLSVQMEVYLKDYETYSRELNEVSTLIDSEVMKSARVVGVTTATAARRHDLMIQLMSPVVIVEEAAEVLEAHIVACLTHQCQHLILIGDHKQLRPTASHYKLAKDYNLAISLFERMVLNGIHSRTLSMQRRMRAEFVRMIVPAIYERLDCHPAVYNYTDIRGMGKNLFFYSHEVFEDSEGLEDSWSHNNTLEAQWCVALANYLRQMNYQASEITILATYTGQVALIKQLSKKHPLLHDVKATAVDNYQGEENRIVILSLVRSNREGNIGFLNATNRICVALSRAKEGFYIFGNMSVLKAANATWRRINDTLVQLNAIGDSVTLRCETHTENTVQIKLFEDFQYCRKGSCLKKCSTN